MEGFDALLAEAMPALERFVKFRINERFDAEDIIQEVCVSAVRRQSTLREPAAFKAWLLSIARNKCRDYYRARAKQMELPIEALAKSAASAGLFGRSEGSLVGDTLDKLGGKEKQILYLYFFRDLPQEQIAARLNIPLGTVKSRLHRAKQRFREHYPHPPETKGENSMKKLPDIMPEYTITRRDEPPFAVRWEEIMGWFLVPKLGERLSWAMYDFPERRRTELCEMEVVGRAQVHGIEGVEIASVEYEPMEQNSAGGQSRVERRFIAQLTDTHCRLLAHACTENGVKRYYTFLDGEDFTRNWGFGEDNCGNEVSISPKGDIVRDGDSLTTADKTFLLDVVGRYSVRIDGKEYDTVCVMDCYTYEDGMASEQFLDKNGRTVLWRRFNRDDWQLERRGKKWSELLPENERITVNGITYVHWYDCITDHIL
ncbi:MAG: sigma-70 family RNA polymerase sigma factor [Clostridia bacterium]|nr:sigma-70 family RNA polymerase sigma factor [Clostridia bacterium]